MPTEPVSLSTPPGDTNIPDPIIEPAPVHKSSTGIFILHIFNQRLLTLELKLSVR